MINSTNLRPNRRHNLKPGNDALGKIPIHLRRRNRTQIPTLRIERSIELQLLRIELHNGAIEDDARGIRALRRGLEEGGAEAGVAVDCGVVCQAGVVGAGYRDLLLLSGFEAGDW